MEPIAVILIVGLAIFLAASFTIEQIWERKYVAKHFVETKKDVFIEKKYTTSDGKKVSGYFVDAIYQGKKIELKMKKNIYDMLETNKGYEIVTCRSEIVEVKS